MLPTVPSPAPPAMPTTAVPPAMEATPSQALPATLMPPVLPTTTALLAP